MNTLEQIDALRTHLATMIEWARRPSPIPYIPFREDIDAAERLIANRCICPSYSSNYGHCPIHDAHGRPRVKAELDNRFKDWGHIGARRTTKEGRKCVPWQD